MKLVNFDVHHSNSEDFSPLIKSLPILSDIIVVNESLNNVSNVMCIVFYMIIMMVTTLIGILAVGGQCVLPQKF